MSKAAVFLDRDGVINVEKNFITSISDFELYPQTIEAISTINKAGFYCFVVTNQSAVARNYMSEQDLLEIHNYFEAELKKEGAAVDGIYYCPHYPTMVEGANASYIQNCDCRKPKAGLIEQACRDFDVDLSSSYMIGDSVRDIECGKAKGLKTIGVKTGNALVGNPDIADYVAETILDAVQQIL